MKKIMKIVLAEHFGICFGVRDAIAQAEALASEAPLTILGELAHNPIVQERLRSAGAHEGSLDAFDTAQSGRVMITAHGASDAKRADWRAAGFEVFDGTCPLVRQAHDQLRRLVVAGFFPVVVGQPGHVEVQGLIGDFSEAAVVNGPADIRKLPFRSCYGVISQTTQPIGRVRALVAQIEEARRGAEVRFVDTVCRPTKDRQEALQKLIAETDTIVVVGGRRSNNTLQLVATCVAARKRTIHVERPEELMAEDFAGTRVVGLTAGTSTLPETVAAVQARLAEISATPINLP